MSETNLIEKLRAAMNRRGVSIKEAARMCNIHVDTLERLLGGHTRKLDAQLIDRIATCVALRRNDWYDRHRFIAEVFDVPLAPDSSRRLDFQIEVLMARVAQLEGGLSAPLHHLPQAGDEPETLRKQEAD